MRFISFGVNSICEKTKRRRGMPPGTKQAPSRRAGACQFVGVNMLALLLAAIVGEVTLEMGARQAEPDLCKPLDTFKRGVPAY
jgi:hypothetical protein